MSWNWRELNTFMNILFAHSEMGGMIDDTGLRRQGQHADGSKCENLPRHFPEELRAQG